MIKIHRNDTVYRLNVMHKNVWRPFDKDRACGSGDILADRDTDRQTYSSRYSATAPAGEVNFVALE